MELYNSRRAIFLGTLFLLTLTARAEDALDHWYWRSSLPLNRVRFVGGMFIGVGGNGTLATSVDGKTWASRNTGVSATLSGVAYGNILPTPPLFLDKLFVAVGSGATILSSPDGTNWTSVVTTNTCDLSDVAWNGTTFAAVATRAQTNQPNLLYSTDGTTWSKAIFSTGTPEYGSPYYGDTIVAANGTFIASAGLQFAHDIWRSSSGSSWKNVGFSDQVVGGIAYGNSRFLLVGWEGYPHASTNQGTSWFAVGLGNTNICNTTQGLCMAGGDIAFGNGTFVIARSFLRHGLLTTIDCESWTRRSVFSGMNMSSVAFGNGSFVAVGPDGIYQSEPVATPVLSVSQAAVSDTIQLLISGEVGRSYRLQTSTLSSTWADRWLFTNTTGSVTFVDPITPESSQLFYRVVSP